MDESFSALDIHTRRKLQKIILKICKENNKTIIFVTHDIEEAVFLSDKIVILSARPGRLKRIVEVELEHPRERDNPEFTDLVSEITREIGELEDE
jgi:NitT/TauT family transport system ATP-binding protein